MIRIYYGDDRVRAQAAIVKILGGEYEVLEGEEMDLAGARDAFLGTSLFGARKIVIKGLAGNKAIFEAVPEWTGTEHEVVLWEEKLDKRTAAYKALQQAGVEMKEFKLPAADRGVVFDIFETALRDGPRAVKMCEQIENTNDPYMFMGLMISQAVKKWSLRQGEKEKRVLLELSKLDMQMKSAATSPWTLVKSFLLRASSL